MSELAVDVSVVISTRNRAELLRGCLESLLADDSTVARDVIVVDNASSDNTSEVVADVAGSSRPMRIRCVREPTVGLSHAKNRGVEEARGAVTVFLDDDMVVEDGWADALFRPFVDADVVAVTGRVVPRWLSPPPPWMDGPAAGMITSADLGIRSRPLAPDEIPLGGHTAIRTAVLRSRMPPFKTELGHRGDLVMGGEDVELGEQLRRHGVLMYEAKAVALHAIEPQRITWGWVRKRHFQGGFGVARHQEYARGCSLGRHVARTARAWWRAGSLRRRNARAHDPSAEQAFEEFYAYMGAGDNTARLVWRFPRLMDWLAAKLV